MKKSWNCVFEFLWEPCSHCSYLYRVKVLLLFENGVDDVEDENQ